VPSNADPPSSIGSTFNRSDVQSASSDFVFYESDDSNEVLIVLSDLESEAGNCHLPDAINEIEGNKSPEILDMNIDASLPSPSCAGSGSSENVNVFPVPGDASILHESAIIVVDEADPPNPSEQNS